jgi:hypothetical protein
MKTIAVAPPSTPTANAARFVELRKIYTLAVCAALA